MIKSTNSHLPYQLVYRQQRTESFAVILPPGARFVLCNGIRDGLQLARFLIKRSGLAGLVKDVLKMATPSRMYACLVGPDSIISECYITLSHCKHYEVEERAVVLGPVWTDPACRRKGLATCLLKSIMNNMIPRGYELYYIDTSPSNGAMQRVIRNCGFGSPIERSAGHDKASS